MSWQRRICDLPTAESLTDLEVGTEFAYDVRTVVECPNCGRAGVRAELPIQGVRSAIVHARANNPSRLIDYCVEAEFTAPAPTLLVFDFEGNILAKEHVTGQKVNGSN